MSGLLASMAGVPIGVLAGCILVGAALLIVAVAHIYISR